MAKRRRRRLQFWAIVRALVIAVIFIGLYRWLAPNAAALGTIASILVNILYAASFMIIQFGALFWFLGRGRVYWILPGETGIGFDDVRGAGEVVEVARRIVILLQGVRSFRDMGGEVSRGVLFVGPPGTGKSYLAQAIATESGVPFAYASAPSFQNMFFGIGNLQVMMLYRKARKMAMRYGATVIFIDEIDAIGMSRSQQAGGMGGMGGIFGGGGMGLLNELLLQMDPPNTEGSFWRRMLRQVGLRRGKSRLPVVLTIGATNLPDSLDAALLRPGRFDRKIVIDAPDFDGRKDILQYYLDKVRHETMPLDRLASDTVGYTPAMIRHVINEAVIQAHFDNRTTISYGDVSRARETHEWGLRQPIRSLTAEERHRLAVHEAGHAIAQALLLPSRRVVKVTIIRHGNALGLSATKPLEERYTLSREEVIAELCCLLASRAAERLFLRTELSGVTQDLEEATRLAAAYVGWFGMDGSLYSSRAFPQAIPDQEQRQRIDAVLNEAYKKVESLLRRHALGVQAVVKALEERDELDGDEVQEILQGQSTKALPAD